MKNLQIVLLTALACASVSLAAMRPSTKGHGGGTANPSATQLPQIGNGFVATFVNSSVEYVAGVFTGNTTNSTRAPFPATTQYFPECVLKNASLSNKDFKLDQAKALVLLETTCTSSNGTVVPIDMAWWASRHNLHVLVAEFGCHAGPSICLELFGGMVNLAAQQPFPANNGQALEIVNRTSQLVSHYLINVTTYKAQVAEEATMPHSANYVAVASTHTTEVTDKATAYRIFTARHSTEGPFHWKAGDLGQKAIDSIMTVAPAPENAFTYHVEAWAPIWFSRAYITSSTPEMQELSNVIDGSFYSIYTSVDERVAFSTSPGGLPTDGYNGHTFWDMETWILPTISLFHPQTAYYNGIQYRLKRLLGAMLNAKNTVEPASTGAAFPWESASTGQSVCPWPQGAHSEIHITADVVNAWKSFYYLLNSTASPATKYYSYTYGKEMLSVLNATADFWVSRSTLPTAAKDASPISINSVTPPDEYHFGNNSAYTNAAAREAVQFTIDMAKQFNQPINPAWQEFVDRIAIPFDAAKDYHPEFDGYKGDTVKQADVVLLNYPLGVQMPTNQTARNDLLYYENRTSPEGPAMTWSVFSIGYFSLGDNKNGISYFTKGYENNCFAPFYQWYEVAGGAGCPNFLTGAGGFLQSIWAGLGGLRITKEGIVVDKVYLPEGMDALNLQAFQFRGLTIYFQYVRDQLNGDLWLEASRGTYPDGYEGEVYLGELPLSASQWTPKKINVSPGSESLPLLLHVKDTPYSHKK